MPRLVVIAAMLAAACASAQSPSPRAGADKPMGDYLDMEARSAPLRAYADKWIALARSGDVAALEKSISANMTTRVGADAIRRNLAEKVVPFFADAGSLGRSVTITQTTDGFGSRGFAYYMYIVSKSGAQRPFVLYVVDENGRTVVANILTDHLVKDRHK